VGFLGFRNERWLVERLMTLKKKGNSCGDEG
jgi:hypothetical protein